MELEQEPNTHLVSQEEELLEDVNLYQLKEGQSQNPAGAVRISLHLDTQADVTVVTKKHDG